MFFQPVEKELDQFDIPTNQLVPITIPSPIAESFIEETFIIFKFVNKKNLYVAFPNQNLSQLILIFLIRFAICYSFFFFFCFH